MTLYVCMYVCMMYVCMHVCMYVYIYTYTISYICVCVHISTFHDADDSIQIYKLYVNVYA